MAALCTEVSRKARNLQIMLNIASLELICIQQLFKFFLSQRNIYEEGEPSIASLHTHYKAINKLSQIPCN